MITPVEEKRLRADADLRSVYDLRIFVVGGGFQYVKMFYDAGLKGARNVEDADIVCFTGGEDVDPQLYGETPIKGTNFNRKRDDYEAGIYGECLALTKPMVGICRGSQFLNVMNGGGLWQDVDNHAGRKHSVVDLRTGKTMDNMTSTHHQQMRPADDAEILALASLTTRKSSSKEVLSRKKPGQDDVEAVWYPDSKTLCFQPHPEFEQGECRNYFLDLFDSHVMPEC